MGALPFYSLFSMMVAMRPKNLHLLPEYPRTLHLPHKPNISHGDAVAMVDEAAVVFHAPKIVVDEKVDGAGCAMALVNGHPLIRSREHFLRKGYRKETPAKMQFVNVWGWFYEHIDLFRALEKEMAGVSVYGEWMVAQHGIEYDRLQSWFYAFTLYDQDEQRYVDPELSRRVLEGVGFTMPPLIHVGQVKSYEQLEAWTQEPSALASNALREGIYLKIGDGRWLTDYFKMVRTDYERGALWDGKRLKKNRVLK